MSRRIGASEWARLCKVKAHQTMDQATDVRSRALIAGSTAVDWWAMHGARIHNLSEAELHNFTRGGEEYQSLVYGMLAVLHVSVYRISLWDS